MKLRLMIEFDIEHDWDDPIFSDRGRGRKKVVSHLLRRAVMTATMQRVAPVIVENAVNVVGMTVSEPEWIGWDNDRIAREVTGH